MNTGTRVGLCTLGPTIFLACPYTQENENNPSFIVHVFMVEYQIPSFAAYFIFHVSYFVCYMTFTVYFIFHVSYFVCYMPTFTAYFILHVLFEVYGNAF